MRIAFVSTLLGAGLWLAAPGVPGQAEAQPGARPPANIEAAARLCRGAMPRARRFVGKTEGFVRARFRAPPGVMVRYCLGCTMDYRPYRLTFALNPQGRVRAVTCG